MIYIPTITTNRKLIDKDYCLYSPSEKNNKIVIANKITIWDNHTFYFRFRYFKPDKQEKAFKHNLWLIDFIINNYKDGITLITPDIEWLNNKDIIQEKWLKYCKNYPQLYVPNTWDSTEGLNIVGYALRNNSTEIHPVWNHCLRHIRNIDCSMLTYDSIVPRTK